ncbi:MAG: serine/threonine-protein kinase [Planctomycetes bacterium]|nr:serine/threonine-protein kinase [Planctomycetota bacterium]
MHVGPYELISLLGQGGMGTVHRARHVELGAVRAVKLLRPRPGADRAQATARFGREVRTLASVRHPNVVGLHEAGVRPEDGAPWFAMDLVEGEPLDRVLARGPLPLDRALALMIGVCRGVEALHAAGVVHRDLKPQNVIVAADGRPVVIDLGLALDPDEAERLTLSGALVGTPHYMAPEQLGGRGVSPRTDVHALGLLLYEVVTGEPALGADSSSVHQVIGAVLARSRPTPSTRDPTLPDDLDAVCRRAAALDPADRHADAGALAAALEALRARPGPSRRARQRRRAAVGAGGAALLALAAAALAPRGSPHETAQPPPPATASPPSAPSPEEDERAAQEALAALRRAKDDVRVEVARQFLARWPTHPGAAAAREARRAAPLARLACAGAPGWTLARFVGPGARAAVVAPPSAPPRLWTSGDGDAWADAGPLPALDDPARALAVSPDRGALAVALRGGSLVALEGLVAGAAPRALGTLPEVAALALAHDGAVAAAEARSRGGRFAVHLLAPGAPARVVGGVRSDVRAVALTRAGLLLTGSGRSFRPTDTGRVENALVAWDVTSGEERWRIDSLAEVSCLALSPDERTVAAGLTSGQLLLVSIDGPEAGVAELRPVDGDAQLQPASGGIKGLAFSPDGQRLYSTAWRTKMGAGEGSDLRVWSVADRRELRPPVACGNPSPSGLDVSPDGTRLLVATREGHVEVWSPEGE